MWNEKECLRLARCGQHGGSEVSPRTQASPLSALPSSVEASTFRCTGGTCAISILCQKQGSSKNGLPSSFRSIPHLTGQNKSLGHRRVKRPWKCALSLGEWLPLTRPGSVRKEEREGGSWLGDWLCHTGQVSSGLPS